MASAEYDLRFIMMKLILFRIFFKFLPGIVEHIIQTPVAIPFGKKERKDFIKPLLWW